MPSFNETLERMKGLITYGNELNESKNLKTHTLEHRAVAADGITYGIIRENSKYYIKSAPKGKETIAEAYDYLGGFCNKSNYEYTSYANALKQFELKMASINEAHDQKVNIESLNPFRTHQVLREATDAMRDEIARQRQIMYNAAMLMNESTEIGAARKDDVVKFDGKNPEAETGKKGDEGGKKATAQPEYKGSKTGGVQKKVAPFNQNASASKDQLKEDAGDIGDAPLHSNTENWGTEGIGKGRDPKQVGWEMDGQKTVNEEENDWASKGLPSSPGVGEADTDHNNDPFNKGLNEEDEFDDDAQDVDGGEGMEVSDVEGDDMADTDFDGADDAEDFGEEGDDMSSDTDFDAGVGDEEGAEDFAGEDDEFADEPADDMGDEDLDSEPADDEMGGDEDLRAQIEQLQSQLDALRAQLDGEDGADDFAGEEPDFEGDAENLGDDDDFGTDLSGEGDDEFNTDFSGEGEDDFDSGLSGEGEGDFESDFDDVDGDEFGGEGDFEGEEGGEDTLGDDENLDECPMGDNMQQPMMESKRAIMNRIVESVTKQIMKEQHESFAHYAAMRGAEGNKKKAAQQHNQDVDDLKNFRNKAKGFGFINKDDKDPNYDSLKINEDELHVFGKHPGYRKKPMELPTTGEDKNQWGEDWNDESVHSEEPFGSKIGNGDPFNNLVNAITKDVMYQLKAGIPIEGENKKKE